MYRRDKLPGETAVAGWPTPLAGAADPAPLRVQRGPAARFVAPLISLAVLAIAVASLRDLNFVAVAALVPRNPGFWLLFALSYLTAPVADWVIFRRLWGIPVSGLLPLVRKLIGNELLLGYVGELYFYAWARRHVELVAAPFGAIKDVTVLSALAGNGVTLVMLVAGAPLYVSLGMATGSRLLLWSVAAVLATSVAAFAFRRRLFSLPRRELRFVTGIHLARIAAITGLTAALWHLALPDVALVWWLLLVTLRMLLSRLPFLPNKDIVFAGIAVLLIGHDLEIGALMAMMASLILATHVLLGIGLMSIDLARVEPPP